MIEVVVRPIVHGYALRGCAIPVVQIEWKQRADGAGNVVAEVMTADLPMIVGETVRIRFGFREQQETYIFINVSANQNDIGRLEKLLSAFDVSYTGSPPVFVHFDSRHACVSHDAEAPRLHRLWNRRYGSRTLCINVTAALVAVSMVGATRTSLIGSAGDCGRRDERMPTERASRHHHFVHVT